MKLESELIFLKGKIKEIISIIELGLNQIKTEIKAPSQIVAEWNKQIPIRKRDFDGQIHNLEENFNEYLDEDFDLIINNIAKVINDFLIYVRDNWENLDLKKIIKIKEELDKNANSFSSLASLYSKKIN